MVDGSIILKGVSLTSTEHTLLRPVSNAVILLLRFRTLRVPDRLPNEDPLYGLVITLP